MCSHGVRSIDVEWAQLRWHSGRALRAPDEPRDPSDCSCPRAPVKAAGLISQTQFNVQVMPCKITIQLCICFYQTIEMIFCGEPNRFKTATTTGSLFHNYRVLNTTAFWFTTQDSWVLQEHNLHFIILGCLPRLRKSLNCWLTDSETPHQDKIHCMI